MSELSSIERKCGFRYKSPSCAPGDELAGRLMDSPPGDLGDSSDRPERASNGGGPLTSRESVEWSGSVTVDGVSGSTATPTASAPLDRLAAADVDPVADDTRDPPVGM